MILLEAVLNRIMAVKNPSLHIDALVQHYKSLRKSFKKISQDANGNHIYRVNIDPKEDPKTGQRVKFYSTDAAGNVQLSLSAHMKRNHNNTQTLRYLDLSSFEGNKHKAHELYHHLITNHNMILQSENQSHGAIKVWKRLAKMKGVRVHGWNEYKHQAIPLEGQPTHITVDTYFGKEGKSRDQLRHLFGMSMVAGPTKIKKG